MNSFLRGMVHVVRGIAILWVSVWCALTLVVVSTATNCGGEVAGLAVSVSLFVLPGVVVVIVATLLLRHASHVGLRRGFDVVEADPPSIPPAREE